MFRLSENFNELSRDKITRDAVLLLKYYKEKSGRSSLRNNCGFGIDIERVCEFILNERGFEYFVVSYDEPDYKEHFFGQTGFRANGYTNHFTKKIYIANQKYNLTPNFTLAHELKHVLVDHDRMMSGEPISKEEKQIMENKANDFARSLLLPQICFWNLYEKLLDRCDYDFDKMMPYFVTDFEAPGRAILLRACELEIIYYSDYERLKNKEYLPIR